MTSVGDMGGGGGSSAAPGNPPVLRMNFIKPLQNQTAVMVTNYMKRQVIGEPDFQRGYWKAGNLITMTVNLFNVDYINLKDSMMLFRVRLRNMSYSTNDHWEESHAQLPVFALGAGSMIERLRIEFGTSHIQDTEFYNLYQGVITENTTYKHYNDEQTLFNLLPCDAPYRDVLHRPITEQTDGAEAYTASQWAWVKVPLHTVLNDIGYIPVYQTADRLKMVIRLADNATPFTFLNGPGSLFGERFMENAEPNVDTDTFTGCIHQISPEYDTSAWTWEISEPQIVFQGLVTLSGGKLDSSPVTVYAKDITTFSYQSNGDTREAFTIEAKKSSIESMIAVPIDPDYNRNTSYLGCTGVMTNILTATPNFRRPLDLWMRGGRSGDPDTQISHYKVSIGGEGYPLPTGAGITNPPNRDYNVQIMYNEILRFKNMNFIEGEAQQPHLRMYSPWSHGTLRYCAFGTALRSGSSLYANEQDTSLESTRTSPAISVIGQAYNPYFISPLYYQYMPSIYGGVMNKWTYPEEEGVDLPGKTPMGFQWETDRRDLYVANESDGDTTTKLNAVMMRMNAINAYAMGTQECSGGKFTIMCPFTQLDKAPKVIQGVDTERYNVTLQTYRNTKISVGTRRHMGGRLGTADECFFYDEAAPLMVIFLKLDKKITISNGTMNCDD